MLNLRHPDSLEGRSLLQRKVQFNKYLHLVKVPKRLTKTVGFNTQTIIVDAVNTAAVAAHWIKFYSDKLTLLFRQIILGAFVSKMIEYIAINQLGTTLLKAALPPYLFVGCLLFSFIIGSISGIWPAWRASKVVPVEALRYE